MADLDLRSIEAIGLDLEQYFGLWAVEEARFLQTLDQVRSMDLAAHVRLAMSSGRPVAAVSTSRPSNSLAIQAIDIQGTMTKRGSSMSSAGSSIELKRAVRKAAQDPETDAILLRIDSPGGTVAGTQELADEVRRAGESKPVWAYVEDMTASAAYWVASQCERIYANTPTAVVGSIGTFIGMYDLSGAAAKEGVRAVVIKAGALKGAGFPGTEITEEQVAYWQQIVDATQEQFTAGVAEGRGKSIDDVREQWVTGRVYMAQDAVAMGLIDGIRSFEQTVEELSKRAQSKSPRNNRRSETMSEEKVLEAVTATLKSSEATIGELKANCPGADAEFLMAQLEGHATVAAAQTAWIGELNRRLEVANKAAADAQTKVTETKKPGAPTIPSTVAEETTSAADPAAAFEAAVKTLVDAGTPRAKAISTVVAKSPELHKAYLAEMNKR